MKSTIQIFSDECGYEGDNQFGCIAKIVGEKMNQKELNIKLSEILNRYQIEELKFKKINNYKKVNAATEFIDQSLYYVSQGLISIHVIIWDKKDSRHNIQGRCDIANLCRMYYHNLKSIKKAWKVDANWEFYPDEFSAIDWENDILKYLTDRPLRKIIKQENDLFSFYQGINVQYSKVQELNSKKFPILQLADLYAGLCQISRKEFLKYRKWQEHESGQQQIFKQKEPFDISNTIQYKFKVKRDFKLKCDKLSLGVNISKNGYLQTFKPSRKLNIWHYTPQSILDKAPTRNST